jgi:predicted nuclease of predicted toxin-antitoxin system
VRLLLDECIDRRLARDIRGHKVSTVFDLGWAGIRNGALLARTAGQFDVFVTADRNLVFQQRTDVLPFAVVVLRARTNRLADLRPLVSTLLQALPTLQPGEVRWIPGS